MNDSKPDKRLKLYFDDAASWARDREQLARTSKRTAWIVAALAFAVAVLEAIALLLLTPLKRVEPITLMVDRQTGYVQALRPLDAELVSPDHALTQSFIVQYVIAREGFDIDSLQSDYRKVALWSAGMARSDYLAKMQANNPDSPLARYPRSAIVEVRVKTVTSIGQNSVLVRFDTIRRDASAQGGATNSWAAVVRYTYAHEPLSVADRFINPLGFQVLRYRRSQEALTLSSNDGTVAATPAAPTAYPPSAVSGSTLGQRAP